MVAVGGLCGVVAGGEGGDRGSREEGGGGWGRKGSNVDGRMNLSGVQWGEGERVHFCSGQKMWVRLLWDLFGVYRLGKDIND